MISFVLIIGLSFGIHSSYSQGFDAGEADPLGLGLIDPLALEIASTYVFIIPMVIFLVGILAIPASLVIVFLVAQPIFVPAPDVSEGRRKRSVLQFQSSTARRQNLVDYATNLLSKSQCFNRVVCEIGQGIKSSGDYNLPHRRKSVRSSDSHKNSRRKRNVNWKRSEQTCSKEFPCPAFDFFMRIGNSAFRGLQK